LVFVLLVCHKLLELKQVFASKVHSVSHSSLLFPGTCITVHSVSHSSLLFHCTLYHSTQCVPFKLAVPLYPVSQYTVCHIQACCSIVPCITVHNVSHSSLLFHLYPVSQYTVCHIQACYSICTLYHSTQCVTFKLAVPLYPVSQYTVCHM